MSQAKVDRYKEQKKNRQAIIKKEKREWMATKVGLGAVAAVIVAWVGISVYSGVTGPDTTTPQVQSYSVKTDALDNFIDSLDAE